MALYEFNALPYERQLVAIFDEGTFLGRRWEEKGGINLYHLPGPDTGLFAEVYYDMHGNKIAQAQAFTSSDQLVEYAANAQLPSL
jgi:hypothetical protein